MFYAIIHTKPKAKGRPRVTKRGFTYTPKATREAEKEIAELVSWSKDCPSLPTGETIEVDVTFYMPIPKSISKKKRANMVGTPHNKRPDLDNLLKLLLDAVQGILFIDDSQIYKIIAQKVWSKTPKIEILIDKI